MRMKSLRSLPPSTHPSYRRHRRQVWTQILLPLVLAVIVMIAVILLTCLATFRDQSDPGRWAAISTIWLTLPMMVAGLLFLILLVGMIYLLAQLMDLIPPYSYLAQKIIYRLEANTKRAADMVFRPVLFVELIGMRIRKLLGRA